VAGHVTTQRARPYVVAHVAVSVDGATTGFAPDVGRFYELAGTWNEDLTLAGSGTILAQESALASAPRPGPARNGPLLAVVDGKGRVRQWDALREVGHWSDVLALYCAKTPPRPAGQTVGELVTGTDRVDLAHALAELGRRAGVATVRVDSGGALTGALIAGGLLDELSLLVHPLLAGGPDPPRWYGPGEVPDNALDLVSVEALGGGLVWMRYRLRR
jgi:2,5-diamino-6-(ribosylamino)-4(3H)-pyrimidinone 5'-phosphate reductase